MPPVKTFKKEDIIDAAYNLVREEGKDAVNARRIAQILGSSVQPIFHNFSGMEELINAVYLKVYEEYRRYLTVPLETKKAYKQIGLGYIEFAKDYPEFFKWLFMGSTVLNAEEFVMADPLGDSIIKAGQLLTGLPYEEQKKYHIKVWIFTHGLACLVATKTIDISEDKIAELLEESIRQMTIGYKYERGEMSDGKSNKG